MPKMDYSRLLGKIREKGFTQKSLSENIGVSESHLCQKLAGNYAFKQTEMKKICDLLEISGEEIGSYFFTPELEKAQETKEAI